MDNIKKFEDFLDRMQGLLDNAKKQGHIIVRVEDLENTFPELKESEDERIRKEFCEDIWTYIPNEKAHKYIAWLEKQGEQKPFDYENTNIPQRDFAPKSAMEAIKEEKVDNANKIEPKFKVGDWVVQGFNILKIRCVGDEYYCFETVGGYADDMLVSEIDSLYHLWTIEDAKDGDVLMANQPFIFPWRGTLGPGHKPR